MHIQLCVDIAVVKDESEFHAFCPAFKGLHVYGATVKEAIKNACDAVTAYVSSLIKHNEPIPCCKIIDEDMLPDGLDIKKRDIYHRNVAIPMGVPA